MRTTHVAPRYDRFEMLPRLHHRLLEALPLVSGISVQLAQERIQAEQRRTSNAPPSRSWTLTACTMACSITPSVSTSR